MATDFRMLFTFFAIYCINNLVESKKCTCEPAHPQSQLCDADYSVNGTVIDVNVGTYDFQVDKIFKGDYTNLVEGQILTIINNPKINCPDADLTNGTSYYLAGDWHVNNGAHIDRCDVRINSTAITEKQLLGFEGEYSSTCSSCSIREAATCNLSQPNIFCCHQSQQLECYSEFSTCKNMSGQCQWDSLGTGGPLDNCLANI